MSPRVSVVVPNFNYGGFIGETLDSVLGQTFTDWELIVVDDNSTDDSGDIVRRFAESHPNRSVSLIVNPRGPSGTPTPVNIGLGAMRGEYFAWLSSDDVFEPEKLERQVRFLEEHPSVGMVHTSYVTIDAEGSRIGEYHPPDEFEADAFTALIDGNFINGNTVLIRREVMDRIGPFLETDDVFPQIWRAAEYYHWLSIAHDYPIAAIDLPLHRSRRHEGNAAYNAATMGPALERMIIRRFFQTHTVVPTPEIVVALGCRGLASVMIETYERLDPADRQRARASLNELETDQDMWDYGRHSGVTRLDPGRVRRAFHTVEASESGSMLRALSGLKRPEYAPYRAAAARRLAEPRVG